MNIKLINITFLFFISIHVLVAQQRVGALQRDLKMEDYPEISEKILTELENHGYPFATVTLQATDPEHGDVSPVIVIDSNLFVTFDSIVVKGDVKLTRGFLYPYLGLKRGTPYSEATLRQATDKLKELPFVTVLRDAEVSFVKDKAYLYVFLDPHPTNQFDGYIGFTPSSEKSGQLAINGELTLALQNLFRIGESIGLRWYSSERFSQHLQVSARFPYLFRSRFGVNGLFKLDKQDTSFLTLNYHVGIPYALWNNSYIEPYYDFSSSTLLGQMSSVETTDTSRYNFRKNLYGLKLHIRRLDYLFNPRKGLDFVADLSAGQRSIRGNGEENPGKKTTNYRIYSALQGYIPIGKHCVLTPRLQFGTPISGSQLYNELTKIGGEGALRGFNTNDIAASTFLLYSMEIRYLFGRKSFANIFFDGGTYEQNMPGKYLQDSPFGFGAGVHLAVKSGVFYLEYALGRQMGNPIKLKTGKIHFGIQLEF